LAGIGDGGEWSQVGGKEGFRENGRKRGSGGNCWPGGEYKRSGGEIREIDSNVISINVFY